MAEAKILVVDDDPLQLEIIMKIVEREAPDYDLLQANNGLFALEIAKAELPDIIITDWEMPNLNGIELINKLKSIPATQDIPVIICSGVMISSDHLKTALEAGAADFIRKPVDAIELVARTRSMLELGRSYKEIKSLNESKNEILSVIAHDLRGPVANLNQAVKLAISQKLEGEFLQQFMEMLEPQLHANFNLLNNLLTWARNLRDNIDFQPESIELHSLVEEMLNVNRAKADKKGIRLINNTAEDIKVFADKYMTDTILRNLVANALKFTDRGGSISVNHNINNGQLELSVVDTGLGLPKEKIHQILHSTSHFSTKGTENEAGTGLGLSLCKSFIKRHQSQLKIVSKIGKGSTFSFKLPLA